jgi:hypothetical protein
LDFLTDRLLAEEADITTRRRRRNADKPKKAEKGQKGDKGDKGDKRYTHPGYPNPTTHNTERCWTAHPDKIPKSLREKAKAIMASGEKKETKKEEKKGAEPETGTGKSFAAIARINLADFKHAFHSSHSPSPPITEPHHERDFRFLTDQEVRKRLSHTPILTKERLYDNPATFPITGGTISSGFRLLSPLEVLQRAQPRLLQQRDYITLLQVLAKLAQSQPRLGWALHILTRYVGRATSRHLGILARLLKHMLESPRTFPDDHTCHYGESDDGSDDDGFSDCPCCYACSCNPEHNNTPEAYFSEYDHDSHANDAQDLRYYYYCQCNGDSNDDTCLGEQSNDNINGDLQYDWPFLDATTLKAFAALQGASLTPDTWLVNSGANLHMYNDRKWFTSLTQYNTQIETLDKCVPLQTRRGRPYKIPLVGKDGVINVLTLGEVIYAPDATCNLLSLSLLARKGKMKGT